MFEVKVTVELPGIPEALNNLARAIAGSGVAAVKPACGMTAPEHGAVGQAIGAGFEAGIERTVTGEKDTPTPAPTEKPVSAPVSLSTPAVQDSPVEQPKPVEQPVSAPAAPAAPATTDAQPVTMNVLSMAGAALVEKGKMDAVVNLLKQFGAVAITQLKEEQYASFAAGLRGLGADI